MSSTDIISYLCISSSLLFYLSPFTEILEVFKTRDISKQPYLLYIITIINCTANLIWAFKANIWEVLLTNSVGLIATWFFISVYVYYKSKNVLEMLYSFASIYTSSMLLFGFIYLSIEDVDSLAGLGALINIGISLSTLTNLSSACLFKDRTYIPFTICCFLLLNSILWTFLGIVKSWSLVVLSPSIVGVVLSILQIVSYFVLPYKEAKSEEFKDLDGKENREFVTDEGKALNCLNLENIEIERDSQFEKESVSEDGNIKTSLNTCENTAMLSITEE